MAAPENSNAIRAGAAELETEIARLKEDLRREHEQYLRALADFENYRRRIERDRASAAQSGNRRILLALFEVLDGFEQALEHAVGSPASVSEGLNALHRKLLALLEAEGVTPFDSLGEVFDPALHEAIGPTSSDKYEPGVVAEQAQRGYRIGDEILRPARVRVVR